MAANTFYIKVNDTGPAIEEILSDEDGVLNLSGADVEFHLKRSADDVKVSSPAIIVSALEGHVRYEWIDGDTDERGTFLREWQITFASGEVVTVPNNIRGYPVKIVQELD